MFDIFLALVPILVLLILMVGLKTKAVKAMPVAWLSGLLVALTYWRVEQNVLLATFVKGLLVSADILLIILGAILLLEVLREAGFVDEIKALLESLSSDKRIHVILIAWLFGALIEGAAGFGTSAALAAPLLVAVGFHPLTAVVVSLVGNSTPVSFGALGTPVVIGIGSVLGESTEAGFIQEVTVLSALIHTVVGTFLPLFLACMVSKLSLNEPFKKGLEVWKFALLSGLSFTLPSLVIAFLLGPEFPSLVGGLVGFVSMFVAARYGWFVPGDSIPTTTPPPILETLKPLAPFVLATALLVVTRVDEVRQLLTNLGIPFNDLFGSGISHNTNIFLSPGFVFLVVVGVVLTLVKKTRHNARQAVKATLNKGSLTFVALTFAVAMVQIYLYSGTNDSGLASMPLTIATFVANSTGNSFVLFSPLIGAFGSFIAGSATVSNLLFSSFQFNTAELLGMSPVLIVALQNVGAGLGNMIAPHNVIAASATVSLEESEGKVITQTIVPSLLYGTGVGVVGVLLLFLL